MRVIFEVGRLIFLIGCLKITYDFFVPPVTASQAPLSVLLMGVGLMIQGKKEAA